MVVVDGVEMVDVREAARLVGRTPETVRRWVWSGRLASIRHGNRLLLERSALDAAVGRRTDAEPTSFADWVAALPVTRATRPKGATPSAADLVLADRADRADRSAGPARAGR